jgi:NifU-like protein involved in Fe-S cluster formation
METAVTALYQDGIRLWARKVRNDRRLPRPDWTIAKTSRVCGSRLTLDLTFENDRIAHIGWMARACTLGMASTAIFVEAAPGLTLAEIEAVGQKLRRLLDGEDVTFDARWEALALFQAARHFPSRHGSIMLPFAVAAEAAEAQAVPHR